MATPGPKPTPTRLKLVAGNPGHRPPNAAEPMPPAPRKLRVPGHLSKAAKAEYRRIGTQLAKLGIFTDLDGRALELYAETYAQWCEATEKAAKAGMVIKTAGGYPMINPFLTVAEKAAKQMRALLAEFGMTPSSRTRVSADKPQTNPFDDV